MASRDPFSPYEVSSTYTITGSKVEGFLFDMEATYAIGKYNGRFLGAFKSGTGGGGSTVVEPHAEDHTIAALLDAATTSKKKLVGDFTIKVSKSPCKRCAQTILTLKQKNPELRIRIKVLGLYLGEGAAEAIRGVAKLQSAGIPVMLWDVRKSYRSKAESRHGVKARELKSFVSLKNEHFDEIENRRVRQEEVSDGGYRYKVTWSEKDDYRSVFDEEGISEEAWRRIRITALQNDIARVGNDLDGLRSHRAQLVGQMLATDKRVSGTKDSSGKFLVSKMDSHLGITAKNRYNDLVDEVKELTGFIDKLQKEGEELQAELDELL